MNLVEQFGLDEESFIWQDLAMCVGIPTEVFYDDSEKDDAVSDAAREICLTCPVAKLCLDAGLQGKESGIWGGVRLERGKIVD